MGAFNPQQYDPSLLWPGAGMGMLGAPMSASGGMGVGFSSAGPSPAEGSPTASLSGEGGLGGNAAMSLQPPGQAMLSDPSVVQSGLPMPPSNLGAPPAPPGVANPDDDDREARGD